MIFDANIRLGRLAASRACYFEDVEQILSAMDDFGISKALVYSALARESDYARGNQLLQEKIRGHERLIPCQVAIPHRESPEMLVRQMQGIPALRLFPVSGHYSIRPWCIGSLAQALSDAGKTLLLDFENTSWSTDRTDWEGIHQLCKTYPKLNVIVCGVTMAAPANYLGFIHECKNLYLELSQFVCVGEIKRMAEGGLEGQLIYGSDLPSRHAGAPISRIAFEKIDQKVRRKILHDNLAGLLCEEKTNADITLPVEFPVVDTHVHLGGWNCSYADSGRVEETIQEMERCGIQSAIATSLWACFGEVALGNKYVADASVTYTDRIYGYLTLDPKHEDETARQIETYRTHPGFKGIKLHGQTHGIDVTDSRCEQILKFANEQEWPLLIHQTKISPKPWDEICRQYPKANFIIAHVGGAGMDDADALALADLASEIHNLYFDIAATRNHYGFLEELISRAGANKILYGSDYPLMDFGFELGQVLYSRIDRGKKELILSGNARRIFRLSER